MIKLPWVARKEELEQETAVEVEAARKSHAAASTEIAKLEAVAPAISLRAQLLELRRGRNHFGDLFDGPLKGF